MRASICLILLLYIGFLKGDGFDDMPWSLDTFGIQGFWVHELSEDDAVKCFNKSLNGVSDVIVWGSHVDNPPPINDPIQIETHLKNKSFLYGDQIYLFGCYQKDLKKRRRDTFSCDIKVVFEKVVRVESRHFDFKCASGVYPIPIGGGEQGVNVVAFPIAGDVFSYSYIYILPDPPADQPTKKAARFAVIDIDETAVFTDKCAIQDMIVNCRTVPANPFMKYVAQRLYAAGYTIVYLSCRGFMLHSLTRWQLRKHGFPEGLIFLDLNHDVDTSDGRRPSTASKHKTQTLSWLSHFGELVVGFGDKISDSRQYKEAGVKVIFELAHGGDYEDKTAEVKVFSVKQPYQESWLNKEVNLDRAEDAWGWDDIRKAIELQIKY
ncbi:LNS2 domain-containing protein [Endozoicomonadaceae bacterium StTr2]